MRFLFILFILCVPPIWGNSSWAESDVAARGRSTGLPLPRMACIKTTPINARTGPGKRYPIEHVFLWRAPVEIIDEFDTWRKVRDREGAIGWIHQNFLTGSRVLQIKQDELLRSYEDPSSRPIAQVKMNALGKLKKCSSTYCQVKFETMTGWLPKSCIWGLKEEE